MASSKRYVLVGTGGRGLTFVESMIVRFKKDCRLVGICDTNPGRLDYYNRHIVEKLGGKEVPTFSADDFDTMVHQTRPDTVIVTTVDAFHHDYIVRAMELGCDSITEKPMTIDDDKCRKIMDAVTRTGKHLRVTFNYRWRLGCTLVRKIIQEGTIGDIIHVDLNYLLDTSHGADYFRRWHRQKDKSGGLLVHKGTHHFDLVNWWIDAIPETVFGMGRLAFYGRANAEARGVAVEYNRDVGQETEMSPFAIDLSSSERTKGLYLEAEKYDGYQRDQNVFGDGINIEDSMSVLVKYRTGVILNYSLNAYMPREGFSVAFNGTKGRLEYQEDHGDRPTKGLGERWTDRIVVLPHFGKPYEVPIPVAEGGHGGADPPMQEQLFSNNPPPDTWNRNAGHGQGAASIMVGIAANRSFKTGQPESVAEMCPQLGHFKRLSDLP